MVLQFTAIDKQKLGRPHVARAWFCELNLPSGIANLHSGTGRVQLDGKTWEGVTDPLGRQLVSMSSVEEPRFGAAIAITITLSGANLDFFRSVYGVARDLEGRRADLYWAAFDPETEEVLIPLKKLFPGKMTAASLQWSGVGRRNVSITLESIWSSQNYPFGGQWNGADQRRRYPGDKGLDYVGINVSENWK